MTFPFGNVVDAMGLDAFGLVGRRMRIRGICPGIVEVVYASAWWAGPPT